MGSNEEDEIAIPSSPRRPTSSTLGGFGFMQPPPKSPTKRTSRHQPQQSLNHSMNGIGLESTKRNGRHQQNNMHQSMNSIGLDDEDKASPRRVPKKFQVDVDKKSKLEHALDSDEEYDLLMETMNASTSSAGGFGITQNDCILSSSKSSGLNYYRSPEKMRQKKAPKPFNDFVDINKMKESKSRHGDDDEQEVTTYYRSPEKMRKKKSPKPVNHFIDINNDTIASIKQTKSRRNDDDEQEQRNRKSSTVASRETSPIDARFATKSNDVKHLQNFNAPPLWDNSSNINRDDNKDASDTKSSGKKDRNVATNSTGRRATVSVVPIQPPKEKMMRRLSSIAKNPDDYQSAAVESHKQRRRATMDNVTSVVKPPSDNDPIGIKHRTRKKAVYRNPSDDELTDDKSSDGNSDQYRTNKKYSDDERNLASSSTNRDTTGNDRGRGRGRERIRDNDAANTSSPVGRHRQSFQLESPRTTVINPSNDKAEGGDDVAKTNFSKFKSLRERGRSASPSAAINRGRSSSPTARISGGRDRGRSTSPTAQMTRRRDRTHSPVPPSPNTKRSLSPVPTLSSTNRSLSPVPQSSKNRALSPVPPSRRTPPPPTLRSAVSGNTASLSPKPSDRTAAMEKKKLEKLFNRRSGDDDEDDARSVDETIQAFLQIRQKVGTRKRNVRRLSPKGPLGHRRNDDTDDETKMRSQSIIETTVEKYDAGRLRARALSVDHISLIDFDVPAEIDDDNDNGIDANTTIIPCKDKNVLKSAMKKSNQLSGIEIIGDGKKKVQFPKSIRYSAQYYDPVLLPVAGDDYNRSIDFENQQSSSSNNEIIVLRSDLYWSSTELQAIQKIALRNAQKFRTNHTEFIQKITEYLESKCALNANEEIDKNSNDQQTVTTTKTSVDDVKSNQSVLWLAKVTELKQKNDDATAGSTSIDEDEENDLLRLTSSATPPPHGRQQSEVNNDNDDYTPLRDWIHHPSNVRGLEALILKQLFKKQEIATTILSYYDNQTKKQRKNVVSTTTTTPADRSSISSSNSSLSSSSLVYADQELLRHYSYRQTYASSIIARYMAMADALAISSSETVTESD